MKDSTKRVRIEMVESGLKYLLSQPSVTRKSFFLTEEPLDQAKKVLVIKEHNAKQWQNGVIERLTAAGIIERDHSSQEVRYCISNKEKVLNILSNHKEGGLYLSYFVFPNEVPIPDFIETAPKPVAIEKPNEEIQALSLEEVLGKLVASQIDLRNLIIQSNKENTDLLTSLLKTLAVLPNALKEALDVFEGNIDKRLNGMNKRFSELEETTKSTKAAIDTNQGSSKRLIESVGAMVEAAGQMRSAALNLQKLETKVETLTQQIQNKEKNNLTDILRRCSAVSQEMHELTDMLLKAGTEMEHGNVG